LFYREVYLTREGKWPPPERNVTPTIAALPALVSVGANASGADPGYSVNNASAPAAGGSGVNDTSDDAAWLAEHDIDPNFLELTWSITVAIFVAFGMIGAFASGKIADSLGRYGPSN
jgi:hypothetical protein